MAINISSYLDRVFKRLKKWKQANKQKYWSCEATGCYRWPSHRFRCWLFHIKTLKRKTRRVFPPKIEIFKEIYTLSITLNYVKPIKKTTHSRSWVQNIDCKMSSKQYGSFSSLYLFHDFFVLYQGWNSWPLDCQAGAYAAELNPQPCFMIYNHPKVLSSLGKGTIVTGSGKRSIFSLSPSRVSPCHLGCSPSQLTECRDHRSHATSPGWLQRKLFPFLKKFFKERKAYTNYCPFSLLLPSPTENRCISITQPLREFHVPRQNEAWAWEEIYIWKAQSREGWAGGGGAGGSVEGEAALCPD